MNKVILYIDGENIKHYLKSVLKSKAIPEKKLNLENFNYAVLFKQVLEGIRIDESRYYTARIRLFLGDKAKSQELILKQRIQKSNLEKQGIAVIMSGNVRPQEWQVNGKKKVVFHEKGVDVRMAVDLVAHACDKLVSTAILCSSDSDLQPVVNEVRQRGVEIVYLGFEINPNKGLIYTTNRTILIRNSEVMDVIKK